jgi:N-acyl-D-amino-acid deacylase
MREFDILIRGGTVVDGSEEAERRRADVGIAGETIEAVGDLADARADRVIDATGKIVAPGFIDMHTHSDFASLIVPTADSKVHAGVTTEVLGQCGASAFPLRGEAHARKAAAYLEAGTLEITWNDLAGYLAEAESRGCSVNRVLMVGHNVVRASVMGYADRAPTRDEMHAMLREVEQALEAGVFGLSTGLIYPSGCYATTDEVAELCRPVAEAGALYASHIRSEGDDLEEAVDEVIELHERTGVPVHISHLKCSRKHNWGKIDRLRRRLFDAVERGVDVTADRYPYTAASTSLDTQLPDWVHEGTEADKLARLRDPEMLERIREETLARKTDDDWEAAVVSSCEKAANRRWEGRRLTEIAREMGVHPFDALVTVLLADGGRTGAVFHRMSEENLQEMLRWPFVMIGSDGSIKNVEKDRHAGKPHPRNYGTAPRVLGRYVREKGVLTLEQAVWKLAGFPAARLGLANRGRLGHTMTADVVVFDPETVADRATYDDPHRYAAGVEHVIVGGVPTIVDGRHVGALAGRFLRRG